MTFNAMKSNVKHNEENNEIMERIRLDIIVANWDANQVQACYRREIGEEKFTKYHDWCRNKTFEKSNCKIPTMTDVTKNSIMLKFKFLM